MHIVLSIFIPSRGRNGIELKIQLIKFQLSRNISDIEDCNKTLLIIQNKHVYVQPYKLFYLKVYTKSDFPEESLCQRCKIAI